MVDVQTATVIVAGISVIIGVINSILSNRRAEEQRQMQLFMGVYDRFTDMMESKTFTEMLEWKDLAELETPEAVNHVNKLAAYFEGVGVLVSRGLFSIDLVEDLMGNTVIAYWDKYSPVFTEVRRRTHPSQANQVEALYDAIINLRQQRGTISP